MTKPFGLEELAAGCGRCCGAPADLVRPGPQTVLVFEDLELDQDSYEVRRDGHPIELSPTEFRLGRHRVRRPVLTDPGGNLNHT